MKMENYFRSFVITFMWLLILYPFVEADVALFNSNWEIRIEPSNLAITVQVSAQDSIRISTGMKENSVHNLVAAEKHIEWNWKNNGTWHFRTELWENDLFLTIKSEQPGFFHILNQPSSANGNGFILPIAEGHYVPVNHSIWEDFLLNNYNNINTAEDLSLPLLGMDYGSYSLHWILTNPFNNIVKWETDSKGGLQLSLFHEFTSLMPTKPFSLILHLGKNSLLSGAKRYLQFLIEEKRFETLETKFKRFPEGRKLVGASHGYLWGNGPLGLNDVKGWSVFLYLLRKNETFSQNIYQRLYTTSKVFASSSKIELTVDQKKRLIYNVNQALTNWARENWLGATINYERLGNIYQELFQSFVEHFAPALHPDPERWGGGFSIKTIEKLQKVNLTRLWLGLGDGWEPGLWHPEAVLKTVQAGYLIAPYDSYETALPSEEIRDDWTTAYLGDDIFKECGLQLENGTIKKGFQGHGYYTNPVCVRPILKKRICVIQKIVKFNSWFLDCYASGMVFDDFRPGVDQMTQETMSQEYKSSMDWIANKFNLLIGSEGGNAVNAGGNLIFSHGMQTPVIGWGDPDLYENTGSPFYLGTWKDEKESRNDEPSIVFKPALIKEPYKTIHFAPKYRLPQYQAVFHDSVITTHHWHFDNLKLTNVAVENTLTQLLYNVPPLFHLSSGTLEERLPKIQRIDQFFRPVHERLWKHKLVGFRWLNNDGRLQETEFSDGSKIIANFGDEQELHEEINISPQSVVAIHPDGVIWHYKHGESLNL